MAERAIDQFASASREAPRTLVLAFVGFEPSEPRYRNYYRTDPQRPFCRRYIDPKLDLIRRHFADNALPEAAAAKADLAPPRTE